MIASSVSASAVIVLLASALSMLTQAQDILTPGANSFHLDVELQRLSAFIAGNSSIKRGFDGGYLRGGLTSEEQCILDWNHTQEDDRLQAIDAAGKIPSRILDSWKTNDLAMSLGTLSLHLNGDFDECNRIEHYQYCYNKMFLEGAPEQVVLTFGVCVPKSCPAGFVGNRSVTFINNLFDEIGKLIHHPIPIALGRVETFCEREMPWTAWPIAAMTIVSFFFMLVIVGTSINLYDIYFPLEATHKALQAEDPTSPLVKQQKIKRRFPPAIEAVVMFSVVRNFPKLFTMEKRPGGIACFEGLRALSMVAIILGHNYVWFLKLIPSNLTSFFRLFERPAMNIVVAIPYAVDSFFYLSGFLVAWGVMKMTKKAKFPWVLYYLHRYIRLTPTYMFVMLVFIQLLRFFGTGPIFYTQQEIDPVDGCTSATKTSCGCETYWWANFLYIQNLYPTGGLNEECMGWTWYLANDMQFYIISPFILIPLAKSRKYGLMLWTFIFSWSIIIPMIIGYQYNLASNPLAGFPFANAENRPGNQQEYFYSKPWCRISPYLIGLLCGYIFWAAGADKANVILSKKTVLIGWTLATFILVLNVFGLGDSGRFIKPDQTRLQNAMWLGFNRALWGAMLGWISLACVWGYGGWLDMFLSCSIWMPLSKLTFCAYLVHPLVLNTFYSSLPNPVYYTDEVFIYYFLGNLLFSYTCAAIVSLTVEFPLAALEKRFLG